MEAGAHPIRKSRVHRITVIGELYHFVRAVLTECHEPNEPRWVFDGTSFAHKPIMDALEILKIDHDCIRELFRSNNPILIHREISIHAQIEAEIFYPALRDKAGDVIEKSLDQHARIEQLLREGTHLVELKRAVEEHLEFEEREAFEQARRYLADDLERLGDQLLKRKEELTAVASSCSDKAGVISERKTGERVSREEIDLGRFESEGGRPSTPPPPV